MSLSANLVPGEGPKPCDIMIVGEAPGEQEDVQGRPFVGKAGKRLTEALEIAGLDRSDVYITNVVKYRPEGNRTPTDDEIIADFAKLIQEMLTVRPKFVLLLGNTALKTMTWHESGIMKLRGQIKDSPFLTKQSSVQTIYATIHPSAALRSKESNLLFFADVAVFAKIARGEYSSPSKGDH